MTSTRETFTIRMKSLVFHGNGCTVFNSKGEIVFRVDNYEETNNNEVFLMDLYGQVLLSIKKEKLRLYGHWNGYSSGGFKEKPWFQVRRNCKCFSIPGDVLYSAGHAVAEQREIAVLREHGVVYEKNGTSESGLGLE
ncbi:protein LURP-one-related 11-like [Nicotiana tabacum]|uniref:Protein LURP-one-related 11-like n=1 Tax=Nicotiana tabacum TaxID=4097 RepID=A0AC58S4T9_TOBAC